MQKITRFLTRSHSWRRAVGGFAARRVAFVSAGLATLLMCCSWASALGADKLPVAQFYQKYCASCHGADGNNPRLTKIFPDLPDFADPSWEATHTKVELTQSILHGKGAMPAYKGDLGGHSPAELIDYLREFSRKQSSNGSQSGSASDPPKAGAVDPPPAAGTRLPVAKFFQRYCASCHGPHGKNPKLAKIFPDLPDFTETNWESTHTKAELTKSILNGKGAMPAYRGDLRGHTASELIDYLRGLSQSKQKSTKK